MATPTQSNSLESGGIKTKVVHRCETPPKPQPPEPPHSGEGMASIIRRLQ